MKIQIKGVGYQLNAREGTASVTVPDEGVKQFNNAVEAWNYFTARALRPFEKQMRNELEANGFNRWTGEKGVNYTETQLSMIDYTAAVKEKKNVI